MATSPAKPPATPTPPKRRHNPHPHPRKRQSTTQQNLIGVLVLALGLGMIIGVGYLAYNKVMDSRQPPHTDTAASPGSATDIQAAAATPPSAQTSQRALDLRKAQAGEIEGQWEARVPGQRLTLTIKDGRETIFIIPADPRYDHDFASGTYKYDEDQGILELAPDYSATPPEIKGVTIRTLTSRAHSIITLIDSNSGDMIWKPYVKDDGSLYQTHPIFVKAGRKDSYIAWQRQKDQ